MTQLWSAFTARIRRRALWHRHLAERARIAREHPLRYLFLEVTRRCNLRCSYCGSDCTAASRPEELAVGEWIEVIRQVAADFPARQVMVAVTGGEPLIRSDLGELLRELHRLGFPYGMVTNGFFLDRDRARELVNAGIGSVSLSMDAPGELNDELRGPGATDRVIRGLGHLRDAGYTGKLEIITTVTRPIVPLLPAMRSQVARLRVPYWRVAPVMPIGRAATRPDLVPGPQEIRQLLEFVREARQDHLRPPPEFSEEGFLGNRFEGNVRPYLCQCGAGITIGGIRADGRIGACPELGEAFIQGDIKQERFADVWATRYQSLRDRSWTRRREPCQSCQHYDQCGGGALHLYAQPGAELLRCLYHQARQAETDRAADP